MTIAKRSIISVAANTLKAVLTFSTGILLARGLGPEEYGIFAFLLASFTALSSLLEMGTSGAFFSFISKKLRSRKFFGYYIAWLFSQFFIAIFFIYALAPEEWIRRIWEGESRERVLIAFVAVFLHRQVWNAIAQIGESQRLTARVQTINVSVATLHLAIVGWLFWQDLLSIDWIFYLLATEFLLAAIIAWIVFPITYGNESVTSRDVFKEYWVFCLPLIPYAWMNMVMGYADTWLLQHYGGAVEQAYYSVALQFSAVSLIVTASILRILWKEIAEANELGDKERVQYIYERTNRILFMFGAIISGFLIPWTEEILILVFGEAYAGGALAMAIMFLYPIHQSLGQVNGTMFYALELTKPYVMIGMVFMVVSTISVYFILASADAKIPGLGLASTGLALKMVVLQLIFVNIYMWWLSRYQGWHYSIGYQVAGIGLFLLLGFLAYLFINMVFSETTHLLLRGSVAGVIYIVASALILYRFPSLIGFNREDVERYLSKIINPRIRKLIG